MAKDRFLAQGVTHTKRQRGAHGQKDQKNQKNQRSQKSRMRSHGSDGSESDGVGDISDLEHQYEDASDAVSSADEFLETPAEKRLRLAKDYIGRVQASTQMTGGIDAEQIDRDLIAERLTLDANERSGRWSRQIARNFAYTIDEPQITRVLRFGHALPPTCVALTPDARFVYSGGKDGALVKWDRVEGTKLHVFRGLKKKRPDHNVGHCDEILAVAVSSDGRFVASGGRDRRIHVWSVPEDRHLGVFHQHKDAVTGLAFRRNTNHLYSCSLDRMVKLWNIDELGYMDTLFGHQDGAVAIDALQREQAVTVGCRDKTVRLWKIADDAQLVFRAGAATDQHRITKALGSAPEIQSELNPRVVSSLNGHETTLRTLAGADAEFSEDCVDCVTMIDEETFVSGGDSGALCLWSVQKKKPVFIHHLSHGVVSTGSNDAPPRACWISAVAAVPFTDLFFSASSDGCIRMWQMRAGKTPGFDLVNVIAVNGFVNALSVRELVPEDPMSNTRDIVVAAAVGQEPRLGRWEKVSARNVVKVFTLRAVLPTAGQ
ncbi:pre-rRNA processing protein [Coemansia sp. D1744]|nr:pre-rRNA processing protein [Coemansia sp. RSA 1797]KAJ2722595.1 pre-rRNA processing protein [Coemansia sp. D1744]